MYITNNTEKDSGYYDAIYSQSYHTANYQPMYNIVLDAIKKIESPRVLEIGCGVGDLGKMIVEAGFPYRGFDFSGEAVKCARSACPQGEFNIGDAYKKESYLPVDYNTVVALEVLEHVDDLKVIENLPAGVHFFASVPDFNDAAHLRVYQDTQRDIIDRFKPYLDVSSIATLNIRNEDTGQESNIFIFHSVRRHDESVANSAIPRPAEKASSSDSGSKKKVGRNDPCPCGSGRKYKVCCLD